MANERYKATYQELVSTHNPYKPLQKELMWQTELFKTKAEALEFFNLFKNDVRYLTIIDMATSKEICATVRKLKKGHICPHDKNVMVGSVSCWLCPHYKEIDFGFIECNKQ